MTAGVRQAATDKGARENLKSQLAQNLAQLPESAQALHRWMNRLEAAGVGIVVAAFAVALYVSIAWKTVNPILIPVAWFLFAASVAPAMIFVGVDSITLRAFPPVIWPGGTTRFVTGTGAVWAGSGFILIALAAAGFWGFFAHVVGTHNFALIAPLVTALGFAMGVAIAVSIIFSMVRGVSRSL